MLPSFSAGSAQNRNERMSEHSVAKSALQHAADKGAYRHPSRAACTPDAAAYCAPASPSISESDSAGTLHGGTDSHLVLPVQFGAARQQQRGGFRAPERHRIRWRNRTVRFNSAQFRQPAHDSPRGVACSASVASISAYRQHTDVSVISPRRAQDRKEMASTAAKNGQQHGQEAGRHAPLR